jgi:FtsP/CotA-like multicopper oxidase with cupredoxin domain
MRISAVAAMLFLLAAGSPQASSLLKPPVSMPQALANDNRVASGSLAGSRLHIALEARQAIWRPDGDGGPGIPIQAFAEVGKHVQIPGPLIRVPVGTVVVASIHNAIPGTVLTMHGMVDRPAVADRAFRVPFGETHVVQFRAGAPGTYLYWGATAGKTLSDRFGVDSQLNGAFVVDPAAPHASANDRVFIISQWINHRDKDGSPNFNYELDTINGRAWPYTERVSYQKGEAVHWRWLNASLGAHPLHLHGYYFTVDSRGNGIADNIYIRSTDRDRRVTEVIEAGNTFTMSWQADRPGNWLFHCHLAYHILGHVPVAAMLASKDTISDDEFESDHVRHAGMGGLILAINVKAPASQVAVDPPPAAKVVHLHVERAADDKPDAPSFRYVVGDEAATSPQTAAIGPPIVLTRGVSSEILVTNLLNEPTAVHWHGIELADSYYDGVVALSGYGKRVAPMIDPGQTFEVRMTPPRTGTFIYHTHMDDVWQLRGGLAGPLIVLDPGQVYDPSTDHVFTITTTHSLDDALKIFVNGTFSPAPITCRVGVAQRLRFINMTTFWTHALVSLDTGSRTAQWRPLAVDGATLPLQRQNPESAVQTITIGETRDYAFTPSAPGEFELQFYPSKKSRNIVRVAIHVVE